MTTIGTATVYEQAWMPSLSEQAQRRDEALIKIIESMAIMMTREQLIRTAYNVLTALYGDGFTLSELIAMYEHDEKVNK